MEITKKASARSPFLQKSGWETLFCHAALKCIKGNELKIICIEHEINYIKIFLKFTKKRKKEKYINIIKNILQYCKQRLRVMT